VTRGVPLAGYRRVRNEKGELIDPPHASANRPTVANVIPFNPRGRDVVQISEKKVANLNHIEIRSQFSLGTNDPKSADVEHTLSIDDGKVDFRTKFTEKTKLVNT